MLKDATPSTKLMAQLPIFPNKDFDLVFDKLAWPLATHSDVPEEFLRMVLSAATTYFLGNRSIDYTYRKQFSEMHFKVHEGERLDFRITRCIEKHIGFANHVNSAMSERDPGAFGLTVAIWTMLRLKFSLRILLTCAQRGALFETAAIARSIFEQLAWSLRIRQLDDIDEITSTSSTKSISELKKIFGAAGQFYGWLSDHAHWEYEAHAKVYSIVKNNHVHLLANSKLKAKSLLVVLIMLQLVNSTSKLVAEEVLETGRWERIAKIVSVSLDDPELLAAEILKLANEEEANDDDFSLLGNFLSSMKLS